MAKNQKQIYTPFLKLFLPSRSTVMTCKVVVPHLSHSTVSLFPGEPGFLAEAPFAWCIMASPSWCLESGHKMAFLNYTNSFFSCLVSTEKAKPFLLLFWLFIMTSDEHKYQTIPSSVMLEPFCIWAVQPSPELMVGTAAVCHGQISVRPECN